MDINEEAKKRREDYLNEKMTHSEYYLWLCNVLGITDADVLRVADRQEIKAALEFDKHLNNIRLPRWDSQDTSISKKATQAGLSSWSLCETVCVLKEWARQMVTDPVN